MEQEKLVEDAKREQSRILKEASDTRAKIIAQAQEEARAEAGKILASAKTEIQAEKESALRDVRREVAMLSVRIAGKIVSRELSSDEAQMQLVEKLSEELTRTGTDSINN